MPIPQHTEARTVRDVVEYQHELVNEVWCRKIFRHVLQALEAQYAAQMPHRAVTPDTIAFQDNGDPVLLPSPFVAHAPSLAGDLRALAAVIHYAITLELAPEAPLRGRRLEGYSESLLGAVDKCLSSDPAQRPQTVDEVRNLLGIVAMGARQPEPLLARRAEPSIPRAAAPMPPPAAQRAAEPPRRTQRWLVIGLAALVLVVAAMVLVTVLRGSASSDEVALSLPPAASAAQGIDPNQAPASSVATQAAAQPGGPAAESAMGVTAGPPQTAGAANEPQPALPQAAPATTATQPLPAAPAPEGRSLAAPRAPALITYRLQVRPWATVYVDGDERGVSPPLKRLALPPGQHTVRLVNPSFPDRVIRIDAGRSRSGTIAHDFSAR